MHEETFYFIATGFYFLVVPVPFFAQQADPGVPEAGGIDLASCFGVTIANGMGVMVLGLIHKNI
ncbi:hypothetical protein ACFSQD_16095 [Flavihumibacter stibioxidans]|uniref:Uncharacterized protein n=1 Tax=Flavihumibacter stibioxidans TaxID=1834163 RepID=A0ABR7M781_9BACT|nr:hypothetical protein [Flavihumibacter stibioxidans]MBC6490872.1 hypothetical protein [Flavihumibacter stibioxidans]